MKCVIFDMDGTLINSEECYYQVWQRLIEEAGYPLNKAFYKTILGCPTTEIKELFLAHYGAAFPFQSLFSSFMHVRNHYIQQAKFDLSPGITQFFDLCQKQNITCGVATSSHKEEAITLLKSMGIWKQLRFSVFGDEIVNGKPNPEIFEKAVRKSGFKKNEIVVFEDSKNGLLSAKRAGLYVYQINDFIPLDETDYALAQYTFKNFLEVLDFCGNSPVEL
ncbi:hypothetical protein IGI39_004605 [Enterococcus sp. AZ135]|uniref:HAD family hydrolase n=1 Tax=unclassified Enterococcus TaxID=2608891 RepID=UPI003F28A9F2